MDSKAKRYTVSAISILLAPMLAFISGRAPDGSWTQIGLYVLAFACGCFGVVKLVSKP